MVTGATGVVGAPILRLLVESGRQVGALVRSDRVGRVRRENRGGGSERGHAQPSFAGPSLLRVRGGVPRRRCQPVLCLGPRSHGRRQHRRLSQCASERAPPPAFGVWCTPRRPRRSARREALSETRAHLTADASSPTTRGPSTWPNRRCSPSGPRSRWWRSTRPPSRVPGRASGTGKLILQVIDGKLPVLVDTRVSMVDIDDCARGPPAGRGEGHAGTALHPEWFHPRHPAGARPPRGGDRKARQGSLPSRVGGAGRCRRLWSSLEDDRQTPQVLFGDGAHHAPRPRL